MYNSDANKRRVNLNYIMHKLSDEQLANIYVEYTEYQLSNQNTSDYIYPTFERIYNVINRAYEELDIIICVFNGSKIITMSDIMSCATIELARRKSLEVYPKYTHILKHRLASMSFLY